MKTTFRILLTMYLLVLAGSAQAQTAADRLDNVIDLARDIKTNVRDNRSALKTLTVEYFQLNNPTPDVAAYLGAMQIFQGNVESLQDDIVTEALAAATLNPALDVTNITAWASQIEAREDFVQNESQNLAQLIAANQRQAARASATLIRTYLSEQIALANQIIAEAKAFKQVPQTFNVRIVLVDNNNNPITGPTGLQGYWAFDQANNVYIYPDYYAWDQFLGLSAGTYTFGAFDGYFDGASSEVVTLDSSTPTDANGFVVVQLTYWSE